MNWSTQKFKTHWINDLDVKDWLQQGSESKNVSFVKICQIVLKNANNSMLLRRNA